MTDPALSFDSILKIIEIVSIIGGGGVVAFRIGRSTQRVELVQSQHTAIIAEIKTDLRKLNEIVTIVALQNERLNSMTERINLIDRRVEDLRRGEGMILPLAKSPYETGAR